MICVQGFHRYSTDEFWHVPHFEKMLYDQAQLACVYLEAYQVRQRERERDNSENLRRNLRRQVFQCSVILLGH